MTRQELEKLCQPLKPGEVLDTLRNLYDDLSNSPGWASEEELESLNASIEVQKAVTKELI